MKVLIWLLCFFVNGLITTLIRESGVILGAIPTVILFASTMWLARTLCQKWDEHKWVIESKKKSSAQQKNIVVEESAKITDANQVRFCRKCGEKLIGNSKFCRKCGTEIVVVDKINNATPSVVNQTSDTIWICGKCKAKNLNSRNNCWSCGNPQ